MNLFRVPQVMEAMAELPPIAGSPVEAIRRRREKLTGPQLDPSIASWKTGFTRSSPTWSAQESKAGWVAFAEKPAVPAAVARNTSMPCSRQIIDAGSPCRHA